MFCLACRHLFPRAGSAIVLVCHCWQVGGLGHPPIAVVQKFGCGAVSPTSKGMSGVPVLCPRVSLASASGTAGNPRGLWWLYLMFCVLCLTVFIAEDICLAVLSMVVLFVPLCRSIVSWVYVILPSAFSAISSRLSEVAVLRGWAVCRLAESRGFGFCAHLSGLLLDRLKTCSSGGGL